MSPSFFPNTCMVGCMSLCSYLLLIGTLIYLFSGHVVP